MREQSFIDTLGYRGPERRLQDRRTPIHPEDRDWRIYNLALESSEQRGSLGRRDSDYAFLAGLQH
ncbi:hypothetical protein QWZ03_12850 [Chitinimonas viridis]|uniref:Uncharacterized protein n=2 Tax=Chitinimonas TaxID=240411 RepID=A0ABT8B7S2_9NEIS|nr:MULTISPECIES: hypothetical protein [Chitinimonas]MDN3577661.1 hypothetical protein [Chitinimonas viridis]GLR15209.1 hypothetical protein GCM10007907_39990 [Chitinimonas prasina]